MKTNCVLWALALYARRRTKGREGYLVIRRSRWGPFPHVLYAERRASGSFRVVSYKPAAPRDKPVPPILFDGRSSWGDADARKEGRR